MTDIIRALANACNLVGHASVSLRSHGSQVAYIAFRLGQKLGIDAYGLETLINVGLIHDIGISSSREFIDVSARQHLDIHCTQGAVLLRGAQGLKELSEIILMHHSGAEELKAGNPDHLFANIINLSDNVSILLDPVTYPLFQRDMIAERLTMESDKYFPEVLEAFEALSHEEAFWIDASDTYAEEWIKAVSARNPKFPGIRNSRDLMEIAFMFAKVIDAKSPFTATHSIGVANVAGGLARMLGFNDEGIIRLTAAGLVHDLGKLAIPDEILDKPGTLTQEERLIVKQHTYHTRRILSEIQGFADIADWAAFHHERLDGRGYPFRLSGEGLDQGARIMAVADVFQALNADRPYRDAMRKDEIIGIIHRLMLENALDKVIAQEVIRNFEGFKELSLEMRLVTSAA